MVHIKLLVLALVGLTNNNESLTPFATQCFHYLLFFLKMCVVEKGQVFSIFAIDFERNTIPNF